MATTTPPLQIAHSVTFTIHGNQEHSDGNPCPYFRVTSESKWSKGAKRYHAWCDHVRAAYIDMLEDMGKEKRAEVKHLHDLTDKKPIVNTGNKIHVGIMIFFKDKTHADSDNVFKGIADALFMNDKYVAGNFDYAYDKKNPRVVVKITFY